MERRTKRAFGIALAVLVVVGLTGLLILKAWARQQDASARARFEAEVGPLDPAAYAPPEVARDNNAARWFRAASGALVLEPEDEEILKQAVQTPAVGWDEALRGQTEGVLERTAPSRELLERARGMTGSDYGIHYSAGLRADTTFLLSVFRLSRLPLAEGRLRLVDGDVNRAVAMARLAAGIAASLRRESHLLAMLFANATENRFLDLATEITQRSGEATHLNALAEELTALEAATVPLARIFAFEGAAGYASLQQRFSEHRPDRNWGAVRTFFFGWWVELYKSAPLELQRGLADASILPYPEFIDRVRVEPGSGPRSMRRILAEALIPNYLSGVERYQATVSARQLARLAVELRRRELESGYPEDLSELGGLVRASPYSGEPVTYERLDDGGARLAYPEAEALWQKTPRGKGEGPMPRLEWTLPPPQ